MTEHHKVYLSWARYTELLLDGWHRVPDKWRFTAITGIPRGGLIAAVMLSHHTGLPFINLAEVVQLVPEASEPGILLVDDVVDSGKTLSAVVKKYWKHLAAVVATLARHKFANGLPVAIYPDDSPLKDFRKTVSIYAGGHYLDDSNTWWVFPYEKGSAPAERDGTDVA